MGSSAQAASTLKVPLSSKELIIPASPSSTFLKWLLLLYYIKSLEAFNFTGRLFYAL